MITTIEALFKDFSKCIDDKDYEKAQLLEQSIADSLKEIFSQEELAIEYKDRLAFLLSEYEKKALILLNEKDAISTSISQFKKNKNNLKKYYEV